MTSIEDTVYSVHVCCTQCKQSTSSVTALPERRSIEDIKKSYPDEWILVGDPEEDEYGKDISGVVLYHSPDKREVAYLVSGRKRLFFQNRSKNFLW